LRKCFHGENRIRGEVVVKEAFPEGRERESQGTRGIRDSGKSFQMNVLGKEEIANKGGWGLGKKEKIRDFRGTKRAAKILLKKCVLGLLGKRQVGQLSQEMVVDLTEEGSLDD